MESRHECFKCKYIDKCHSVVRYDSVTCNSIKRAGEEKSRKEK